jgi:16S rRNA (cytosine967-C5)-methyltransferase
MPSAARIAAYGAFRSISRTDLTLAEALATTRRRLTDPRDRALAAEVLTGTLRWRGLIDHLIRQASGRSLTRLDEEVLAILRISVYQLLYLDRVPVSAVVDDAVGLTKRARKTSAAGLVNAVLRAVARQGKPLALPPRPADPLDESAALDYLATTLSHPRWLAARWLSRYGFESTEAWERFNNAPAPLTLRANRLKLTRDELKDRLEALGVKSVPTRFAPDGLSIVSGNPLRTPLAGTGIFVVQDEASQLVTALARAQPGQRVLDGCSSPGNKATALAADMRDAGLLAAVDIRPNRLELLKDTVRASGARHAHIVRADLQQGAPFRAVFDVTLVDVPCSGLGTLRRDPEIRWRRTEADLADLASGELRILREAAQTVRPGGRLVYSTCSSEPDENEEVVAAFLKDSSEFSITDPREDASLLDALRALISADGFLRTSPVEHGLEAFFGAVLHRRARATGHDKRV